VLRLTPRLSRQIRLGAVAFAGITALSGCGPSADAPAAATDLVEQALRQGQAAGVPTVIEFGANACAACREMKPILAQLASTQARRLQVVDVDVLRERAYLARYDIRILPTQVFFDATGAETSRHMGVIDGTGILARVGLAGSATDTHAR